jgi:hypothetical protein
MSKHAQSKGPRSQAIEQMWPVALSILVVPALVLMNGYAKTPVLRCAAGGGPHVASPQAQPQPIDVGLFIAQGMHVRFAEAVAVAKNDKGSADLTYMLTNNGGGTIGSFDLALFDFNLAGKLMGVQSWSAQTRIDAGASQSFSLKLRHRVALGNRLVLCVEAVKGDAGAWQVDFNDLAQAIGASVTGMSATSSEVKQRSEKIPESFGGAYCSDAFGRAFRLAKSGDGKGLTTFICDRDQHFSAFSFSAKNLV